MAITRKSYLGFFILFLSFCSHGLRNEAINPHISGKRDSFLNDPHNAPTKHPALSKEIKNLAIRYNVREGKLLSAPEVYFFWTQVMIQSGVKPKDILVNLEILRSNAAKLVPEYPSYRRVPVAYAVPRLEYAPYYRRSYGASDMTADPFLRTSVVFGYYAPTPPPRVPVCRVPEGRILDGLLDILLYRVSYGVNQKIVNIMNRCLSGANGLEPFYGLSLTDLRKVIDTVAKREFGYPHPPSSYSGDSL